MYGLVKFEHLINKKNPTTTTIEEMQEFAEELNPVNLRDDTNLRFAFSVMDTKAKGSLLDPRYIKIITRV